MGTTESIFFEETEEYEDEDEETPEVRRQPPAPTTRRPSNAPPIMAKRPATATDTTRLIRLSGRILGLPQTGKHSLLQRLEGKNPSPSDRSDCTVVPYQVPRGQPGWDRIQLRVQISPENLPVNFAVVLVDPRHDRDRIEAFLSKEILNLLQLQGYSQDDEDSKNPRTVKRPFCLCLLLNFCDQIQDNPNVLSASDLQQMTLMALQQVSSLEPSLLHLQCASTSLHDCYGLSILHHFIYQSYLLHKQWCLQQKIQLVLEAKLQSSVPPVIPSYADYLRNLHHSAAAAGGSGGAATVVKDNSASKRDRKKKSKESKRREKVKPSRRSVMPQQPQRRPEQPSRPMESSSSEEDETPEKKGPPVPDSRNALEAFLASEDEDDGGNGPVLRGNGSDDEDDFFYDEAGQRRTAVNKATLPATNSGKSASSDEKDCRREEETSRKDTAPPPREIDDKVDPSSSHQSTETGKEVQEKSTASPPTTERNVDDGSQKSGTDDDVSAVDTAEEQASAGVGEASKALESSNECDREEEGSAGNGEIKGSHLVGDDAKKDAETAPVGEEQSVTKDQIHTEDSEEHADDGRSSDCEKEGDESLVAPATDDSARGVNEQTARLGAHLKQEVDDDDDDEEFFISDEKAWSKEEHPEAVDTPSPESTTEKPAGSVASTDEDDEAPSVKANLSSNLQEGPPSRQDFVKTPIDSNSSSRAASPSSKATVTTTTTASSSATPGLSAAAMAAIADAQQEAELMLQGATKPKKKKKEKKDKKSKKRKSKRNEASVDS